MGRTRILRTAIEGPFGAYNLQRADVYMQSADPANGNYCAATDRTLIIARNAGATAHTVTITSFPDPYGRPKSIVYELGAGGLAVFGPFGATGWAQPDGSHYFEANSTNVEFGVVTLWRLLVPEFGVLLLESGGLLCLETSARIILEE